jgi:hypothetical protein
MNDDPCLILGPPKNVFQNLSFVDLKSLWMLEVQSNTNSRLVWDSVFYRWFIGDL